MSKTWSIGSYVIYLNENLDHKSRYFGQFEYTVTDLNSMDLSDYGTEETIENAYEKILYILERGVMNE